MLSLWRDLLRALRGRLGPRIPGNWGGAALVVVVVTEAFGRRSSSATTDLFWSLSLTASLAVIAVGWGVDPAALLRRAVARWGLESGLDLRGDPPLPRRLPPFVVLLLRASLVALAVVLPLYPFFPSRAREVALMVSPTLYFLGCALVWCVLGVCTVLGVGALHLGIATVVSRRFGLRSSRRLLALTSFLAHVLAIVLAIRTLPAWAPLAVVVAGTAVFTALVFVGPAWDMRLMWRSRSAAPGSSPSEPAVFGAAALVWLPVWTLGCAVVLFAVPVLGEHLARTRPLAGGGASTAAALGLFCTWCATSIFLCVTCWNVPLVFQRWLRNPARPLPVRVVVLGELPASRREVAARLRRAGFAAAFGDRAHSTTDVPVRFVEPVLDRPVRWALPLDLESLDSAAVHFRLARRGAIRRRRQFLHGLHRMWRAARSSPGLRDLGLWLAPHYWYIPFLAGESEEQGGREAREVVGPEYHRWIPLEARVEVREVLDAARIDLLHVERGVSVRGLRRVFQTLFEYHDLFGGQRPAEERSFRGIPGVRVVIHEHELGAVEIDHGYREPGYAELGRARVLHVARDEGGETAPDPAPADRDDVPLPSLVPG